MYYPFARLEIERKNMLKDDQVINVTDLGAGSYSGNKMQRSIKDIASTALSDTNQCRILFQLINYFRCNNTLELGTSLGISSAYMAWANLQGHVTTMEGDPHIAMYAQKLHSDLELKNISHLVGPFDDLLTLPAVKKSYDFVFIDGNHRYDATMRYFQLIMEFLPKDFCILIIDDIYWSKEMTMAWEEIKIDSRIHLTVDLFDFGICIINPNLSKEDITYINFRYKPWRIGLFGK
jgi:predicted O-methyltransferase YrrM